MDSTLNKNLMFSLIQFDGFLLSTPINQAILLPFNHLEKKERNDRQSDLKRNFSLTIINNYSQSMWMNRAGQLDKQPINAKYT